MAKKKMTFESAMEELQMIYDELDSGTIGLDALAQKMKRVKVLTDYCKEKLRDIETVLSSDSPT